MGDPFKIIHSRPQICVRLQTAFQNTEMSDTDEKRHFSSQDHRIWAMIVFANSPDPPAHFRLRQIEICGLTVLRTLGAGFRMIAMPGKYLVLDGNQHSSFSRRCKT